MDTDLGIFRQDRQVFSEVELRPQFSHRKMPFPDLIET
jgi:hypothetical protein